jgi:hypothetical protein
LASQSNSRVGVISDDQQSTTDEPLLFPLANHTKMSYDSIQKASDDASPAWSFPAPLHVPVQDIARKV